MVIFDGSMDKSLYKDVFTRVIGDMIATDKNVVYIDADLMNALGTLPLKKKYPKQAINAGIAEANMMGIAAGLSAGGKKPYVHTFGPFASRRSFDQLFLSVAYAGNSVCVYGSDPGVTAAFNGGTHMPFEDMAMMRAVPEATVIDVSDAACFEYVLREANGKKGLTYIRSPRKSFPAIYSADHKFTLGKGEVLCDGDDLTIIASGLMVSESLKAAAILKEKGVSVRVVDMFTIKPLDDALVAESAKKTGAILTCENHNVIGGLGDAVLSSLAEANIHVPVQKHGAYDTFGCVGPQDYLQEHFGMTGKVIAEKAMEVIAKK